MLSEWITGSKGLGNLILEASELRETELLWAAVLTSVVIALGVFWTTSVGEQHMLHWRQYRVTVNGKELRCAHALPAAGWSVTPTAITLSGAMPSWSMKATLCCSSASTSWA